MNKFETLGKKNGIKSQQQKSYDQSIKQSTDQWID